MPKQRTVRAFSAGGVVFRYMPDTLNASDAAESLSRTPTTIATAAADPTATEAVSTPTADNGATPPSAPSLSTRRVEVVLVGRAWESFWVLPKGTPEPGETKAQVALREVAEESGVVGRIIEELGSIHYWFSRQGVRYNKEVLYYLMEAVGGDVTLHDHEYDDARWFDIKEAAQLLTYANEAELVRQAEAVIARSIHQREPQ